tara:strand:+ start:221 stop:550 length:330 start_codon:yes stop_codon:yes gene_type:complete
MQVAVVEELEQKVLIAQLQKAAMVVQVLMFLVQVLQVVMEQRVLYLERDIFLEEVQVLDSLILQVCQVVEEQVVEEQVCLLALKMLQLTQVVEVVEVPVHPLEEMVDLV